MIAKFSGRLHLGTNYAETLLKDGQYHTVLTDGAESTLLSCGLACSECVSGQNLAQVIKPGLEYERYVLNCLAQNSPAPPLAIHTSAGVPAALGRFIEELACHLPWPGVTDDWFVTLQIEGASAVLAAVDLMIQIRHCASNDTHSPLDRWHIGVAATSYHGPPSSSPGSRHPLFDSRHHQILYPVPSPFMTRDEHNSYLQRFGAWLEERGAHLACILVEPQWGSSCAAYCWNKDTLRSVIDMAHAKGVLVVADEIMCGLGRHSLGTTFLSQAWQLDVDAVTFGKAIAAGVYPLSGVLVKENAALLGAANRTVMQSHTYSGSHVRALMAATEVLKLLPSLYPSMADKSRLLQAVMIRFEAQSDGLFVSHGLGLMWGALINRNHPYYAQDSVSENHRVETTMEMFKTRCKMQSILPYFVPSGGFMVTPLYDISDDVIDAIGARLCTALEALMDAIAVDLKTAKDAHHAH